MEVGRCAGLDDRIILSTSITLCQFIMQIKYIKGIDLSPNEVEEAKRRFQEMKVKRRRMNRGDRLEMMVF